MNLTPEQKERLRESGKHFEVLKLKLQTGAASHMEMHHIADAVGISYLISDDLWIGHDFERAEYGEWLMNNIHLHGCAAVVTDFTDLLDSIRKDIPKETERERAFLATILINYIDAKADHEKHLRSQAPKFKALIEKLILASIERKKNAPQPSPK